MLYWMGVRRYHVCLEYWKSVVFSPKCDRGAWRSSVSIRRPQNISFDRKYPPSPADMNRFIHGVATVIFLSLNIVHYNRPR